MRMTEQQVGMKDKSHQPHLCNVTLACQIELCSILEGTCIRDKKPLVI